MTPHQPDRTAALAEGMAELLRDLERGRYRDKYGHPATGLATFANASALLQGKAPPHDLSVLPAAFFRARA